MNTAIVMMGALLPVLAASMFYMSDRRVSPEGTRVPPETAGHENSRSAGDLVEATAGADGDSTRSEGR
ncbi:hypothetical protein [Actinopolyspora mortivallis]|uniref:hypothetical protein n=1 Tax=Actinopolyspora mortivallis TaxID=33906 RepID=UPI000366510E|nr:hypothetical protein [Actinopolyspora mortivallis]